MSHHEAGTTPATTIVASQPPEETNRDDWRKRTRFYAPPLVLIELESGDNHACPPRKLATDAITKILAKDFIVQQPETSKWRRTVYEYARGDRLLT